MFSFRSIVLVLFLIALGAGAFLYTNPEVLNPTISAEEEMAAMEIEPVMEEAPIEEALILDEDDLEIAAMEVAPEMAMESEEFAEEALPEALIVSEDFLAETDLGNDFNSPLPPTVSLEVPLEPESPARVAPPVASERQSAFLEEAEGTEEYDVQRIFFGTDRVREGDDINHLAYGGARAGKLTLGYSDITIPKLHGEGAIERPREINLLFASIRIERESARKHFTELETVELDQETFVGATSELAKRAELFPNSAFVFVHGFNVTFQDAMFRAAQMGFDMGFDGPVYTYSWPSQGGISSYVTDLDSSKLAVPHLDAFLEIIANTDGIDHIHLVAHSMGNNLLAQLFQRAETRISQMDGPFINQLILAAPDIDRGEFKTIKNRYLRYARNVTLYASANDRALQASKEIRDDFARAGDVPENEGPVIVEGIDSIDVSSVSTSIFSLNHSEYAEDKTILGDLTRLIKSGQRPPSVRSDLFIAVKRENGTFYQISQ